MGLLVIQGDRNRELNLDELGTMMREIDLVTGFKTMFAYVKTETEGWGSLSGITNKNH